MIDIVGVIGFSVSRRVNEIGIRMALGADHNRVLGVILREGMVMVGVRLAVGLAGALVFNRAAPPRSSPVRY